MSPYLSFRTGDHQPIYGNMSSNSCKVGLIIVRPILRKFIAICAVGIAVQHVIGMALAEEASLPIRLPTSVFKAAYLVPKPNEKQVTIHVLVQSGENDNPGTEGLAHYVEHLAWQSALGASVGLLDRHSNASTTSMTTDYFLQGPASDLNSMFDTLTKVLAPLTVDQKFAEDERNIILREYDYRRRDRPLAAIEEALKRSLLGSDPRARSVLGAPNDITQFSFDEARTLHASTHCPANSVLVVGGPITAVEITTLLARPIDVRACKNAISPKPLIMPLTDTMQIVSNEANAPPHLMWYKLVELDTPIEIEQLDVGLYALGSILNANLPGGLAGPLRDDADIADSFQLWLYPVDERHVEMGFFAKPRQGVTLAQVLEAFNKALGEITETGIPNTTFQRVRDRVKNGLPDWKDRIKVSDLMWRDVLDHAYLHRLPLMEEELKKLPDLLEQTKVNNLLKNLAGAGRIRFAFIGENP